MDSTTQTTAPLTASFARLRDGSWGLRIPGRVTAGQTVIAVTRDGRRENLTIGSVLFQAAGDKPALCTIGAPAAARPSSPISTATRRTSRPGRWTGCSCGSREDAHGQLIPARNNCASCEHDA